MNEKNHIYGAETLLIIGPHAEGMSLDSGKQNICLANSVPPPAQKKKIAERGRAVVVVLWTVNNPKVVLWSYVVCENDHGLKS